MDQAVLVRSQIEDGQKLLERLVQSGIDARAAAWARKGGEGQWYLYIATPLVDTVGSTEAYRRVQLVMRDLPGLGIDSFEVKLIGLAHPLAEDLLAQPRAANGQPMRYGGWLGNRSMEVAIIYSVPPA